MDRHTNQPGATRTRCEANSASWSSPLELAGGLFRRSQIGNHVAMAPPTGPAELEWREQCADRIASELHLGSSRSRLAKASSLLHAFRSPGAHVEASDVKQALEVRGIRVTSPRPEIPRRDVIELCPAEGSNASD